MWGNKKKEKIIHHLIFVYPSRQGQVQLSKAEWSILETISKNRNLSLEDTTLLFIRMGINHVLDVVVEKQITKDSQEKSQ